MISKKIVTLVVLLSCIVQHIKGVQPPGIDNFGATCYLNATIQNLFNYTPLNNLLVNAGQSRINYPKGPEYQENDEGYPVGKQDQVGLARSYVQLILELKKGKFLPKTNPVLKNFVRKHAFRVMTGCGQQDAFEFVAQVLNRLMEEDPNFQDPKYDIDPNFLKRDHPIGKLISISQASIVTCPEINYQRQRDTYELMINPAVGRLTTVKDCLYYYFADEQFEGPNNFYRLDLSEAEMQARPELIPFHKTGIANCNRRLALNHTSDLVIIALKRYEQDMYGGRTKLHQNILVDQVLNFGPYMAKPEMRANQPNYNLIGAIIQAGNLGFGHYIAFVKSNGIWYSCNDTVVQRTTWAQMQNMGAYGINQSYMLFYQRQGAAAQVTRPPVVPQVVKPPTKPSTGTNGAVLIKALQDLRTALDGLNAIIISQ